MFGFSSIGAFPFSDVSPPGTRSVVEILETEDFIVYINTDAEFNSNITRSSLRDVLVNTAFASDIFITRTSEKDISIERFREFER